MCEYFQTFSITIFYYEFGESITNQPVSTISVLCGVDGFTSLQKTKTCNDMEAGEMT